MYSRRVVFIAGVIIVALHAPASFSIAEDVKIIAGPMFTLNDASGRVEWWCQTNTPLDLEVQWRRVDSGIAATQIAETTKRQVSASDPERCVYVVADKAAIPIDDVIQSDIEVFIWAGLKSIGKPLYSGRLRRIPRQREAGRYTIAFGSCSHQGKFPQQQPIWDAVVKQKPDCFLFIGDNMYLPNKAGEFPRTRDEVVEFYCDTYDRERRVPEMQPLLRSTMCFALWDDHDYGPNNADRTWPWKDVALEAFKQYFPGKYGLPDAPGCFRMFSWGDIDVFMLDDRSFRDPNNDSARKTFLGEKQLGWLKEGLATSKGSFKLIVCGNQILSDAHPHESWGVQFRPERDAFLAWMWEKKIEGVIFLAGDRHFAELVKKSDPKKRGADLWELTSSPLANDVYKDGLRFGSAERVAGYIGGVNFGVLKFDTTTKPPSVDLMVLDEKGASVIQQRVERETTKGL